MNEPVVTFVHLELESYTSQRHTSSSATSIDLGNASLILIIAIKVVIRDGLFNLLLVVVLVDRGSEEILHHRAGHAVVELVEALEERLH